MDKHLVSIVVPIYKVEKYLEKCVTSVLAQSYKYLEVILVDDGSPDLCPKICDDFAAKDSRIKVIHQKNGGVSSARNAGIKISKGEYILFVDGDDWISTNCVEAVIEEAIANDVEIVMWSYIKEFAHKSVPRQLFDKDMIFNNNNIGYLQKRVFGLTANQLKYPEDIDSLSASWGKLYKKSIITNNQIKFLDIKQIGTEDALFNIYVFRHVTKVSFINEYLYHYRKDNEGSFTVGYNDKLLIGWVNLFDLITQHIQKNNLDVGYEEALNNRISLSIVGLGLNILISEDRTKQKIIAIKNILNMDFYKNAIQSLSLKYFPLHWKIFYACAKRGHAVPLYCLLRMIKQIRNPNLKR